MSNEGSLPPDPLNDPAFRDRRSLYLDDWTALVEPYNKRAAEMVGHSVTYGSGALQASYLINGGALAALPAFFSIFTTATASNIFSAAFPFVLAIIATALASTAAYLNFQVHAGLAYHDAEHQGSILRRFYERSAQTDPSKAKRDTLVLKVNISYSVGLGAALFALAFFIWGAWEFKDLAARTSPHMPRSVQSHSSP